MDEDDSLTMTHKVADIGRYRLIAELARGGMGIVFLALVRGPGGFNKLFVVKVLKGHLAEDPKLVYMFLEEARLAAKLNHPNVVQTIEVGSDGGRHYIAMEFLDGQSLHRLQGRGRRTGTAIPLHYQLHVLVHLLEGLQYAHGLADFDGTPIGLVHRDVSPQNVLITYEGQVKILDFGIAKALDSSNDTRTGMLKGKVAYMAPEQAAGEAVDRRTDLFAVGVMLWEAAVGQRMWNRTLNDMQILHALMGGTIPKPRDAKPDLDPRLERMILKATEIKPSERYGSAAEMQVDIEAYIKDLGAPAFGSRDLGKFVSDVFVEERAQIKGVIDEQLRLLRGISSGEHAKIDLPLLTSLSAPQGTPSGVLLSARDSMSLEGSRAAMLVPTPVPGRVPAAAAPRRSMAPLIAVLVFVGLLAVGGVVFLLRPRGSAPSTPTATQTASASATTSSAPANTAPTAPATSSDNTVQVRPTSTNEPAQPHDQVAAAPTSRPTWPVHYGYRPATPPASTPPVTTLQPPPAVTTPPPQPTATAHVRQQIDTSNPYGQ